MTHCVKSELKEASSRKAMTWAEGQLTSKIEGDSSVIFKRPVQMPLPTGIIKNRTLTITEYVYYH